MHYGCAIDKSERIALAENGTPFHTEDLLPFERGNCLFAIIKNRQDLMQVHEFK